MTSPSHRSLEGRTAVSGADPPRPRRRRPTSRRRYIALVVAGLVAAGATVFAVVRSSADNSTAKADRSFCWGTLGPDHIAELLPTGRDYRDTAGPLGYPRTGEERCAILAATRGAVFPELEFGIYTTYQDLPRGDWFGPSSVVAMPFGNGVLGAVSDTEAWVALPRCVVGDTDRFAQLTVREPRARTLLADTLVRMANQVRSAAACTEGVLPAPGLSTDRESSAFDPGLLCGVPLSPTPFAERPGRVQLWSGRDELREDCIVVDGSATDQVPEVRVEVYRGALAVLEIAQLRGSAAAGKVAQDTFSYGGTAALWAVCGNGGVAYVVGVKADTGLPSPEELLYAVIAGSRARDGCDIVPGINPGGSPDGP